MCSFEHLKSNNDLKEILKAAFDANLSVLGSWGYTQALATIIESSDVPIQQFEHMLASMRAYVEMNMTKEKDARYGSININEITRNTLALNGHTYHKVTYKISAMKESTYAQFIQAYKEGYGKEDFDLEQHFKNRKEATLTREVTHWFDITLLG
jgi:hypothetical protein